MNTDDTDKTDLQRYQLNLLRKVFYCTKAQSIKVSQRLYSCDSTLCE